MLYFTLLVSPCPPNSLSSLVWPYLPPNSPHFCFYDFYMQTYANNHSFPPLPWFRLHSLPYYHTPSPLYFCLWQLRVTQAGLKLCTTSLCIFMTYMHVSISIYLTLDCTCERKCATLLSQSLLHVNILVFSLHALSYECSNLILLSWIQIFSPG